MKIAKLMSFLIVISLSATFASNSGASGKALVYNGHFADSDGALSMSALVESFGLETVWFDEPDTLPSLLDNATIVIVGGTLDDINPFVASFSPDTVNALKAFIEKGGAYLGICGGGYIASTGWEEESGFFKALGLVPYESDSFLYDSEPQVIEITWKNKKRSVFYQFGPKFLLPDDTTDNIIATYSDGSVAAFSMKSGKGRIVLVGPHPEADESWIEDSMKNAELWVLTDDMAKEMMEEALKTEPDDSAEPPDTADEVNGEEQPPTTDEGDGEEPPQTDEPIIAQDTDQCLAVLSTDMKLTVPHITSGGTGSTLFSAEFEFVPGNEIAFRLRQLGKTPEGCITASTLSADLTLHISDLRFGTASMWVDLTYTDELVFKVLDYGSN